MVKRKDRTIIQEYLQSQNQDCFEELYLRYANKVFSKCNSILKNEAEAKDATQDIFLKLFLSLSKFKGNSTFSTWVYSITYNYCIDLIRKRKKHQTLFTESLENIAEPIENIPDSSLLEIKINKLKILLEKIPVEDKIVLLMKYQSGMSIREIADTLSKTESAIKMKIKRAKHKVLRVHREMYGLGFED